MGATNQSWSWLKRTSYNSDHQKVAAGERTTIGKEGTRVFTNPKPHLGLLQSTTAHSVPELTHRIEYTDSSGGQKD